MNTIDLVMSNYQTGKVFELEHKVDKYMRYIDSEPFYISPVFIDVRPDLRVSTLNPKIILFSAPGATGKSALAQYIAFNYKAIYWNLSQMDNGIGSHSFKGSILAAVGDEQYTDYMRELKNANVFLAIDALDEAEMISGTKRLCSFISEIADNIDNPNNPPVFLFARTETAKSIASYSADKGISLRQYEISYFSEDAAKDFILKKATDTPTQPIRMCIDSYFSVIKSNIRENERESFLGYAPVLEAIGAHIGGCKNHQVLLNELQNKDNCTDLLLGIMNDLLQRERNEKVIPALKEKFKTKELGFESWEEMYTAKEQLRRIIYYIVFKDASYEVYPIKGLPPEYVDFYQEVLSTFIPQHPFIRCVNVEEKNNYTFTGPAFRDFSLSKILLEDEGDIAELYYEESQEQSFFPSQIFFDCYMAISEDTIHSKHISYLYDSFRAKATAYQSPYLQVEEVDDGTVAQVIFGLSTQKDKILPIEYAAIMSFDDQSLFIDRFINCNIAIPKHDLEIGKTADSIQIFNSSIIANQLIWKTNSVCIESRSPGSCLIVSLTDCQGHTPNFEILKDDELKISIPNINTYYRLMAYSYKFENADNVDITCFMHALQSILLEFRTHRKDTLAKDAEKIDFVTVGNNEVKKSVLEFMKKIGILYSEAHLYKINTDKMQEYGINFTALARMDKKQLERAYTAYLETE